MLLSLPGAAQEKPPEVLTAPPATLVLEEETLTLSMNVTAVGPVFALEPLVARLGGRLELGAYKEGYTLTLLQQEVVFGPDSPAVTLGEEIRLLSQPPVQTLRGLRVPLDFLEMTFGDVLGYRLAWLPETRTLTVERHQVREIRVQPELVHLRGITTLAFEFSEKPRYRVKELPGLVDVEAVGDRLLSDWQAPATDPLVRRVTIRPGGIRIELAPEVAAQSRELEHPFRLVFDIYREAADASEAEEGPDLSRPERTPGVRTVVVDPGHGGRETGALGTSGTAEKDLTLLLARSLKRRLEQRLPVRVVLTRELDSNLPLDSRTAIANQNKADLFISLHLNSSFGAQAHGAETYILSMEASDPRAADSAEVENRSYVAAGDGDPLYDLQLILWDLAQSHQLSESHRFAALVQEELNGALQLRDRGVKQAPFRVLMGAAMPAVLVELGFISNPEEEAKLQSAEYRAELVDALVRAVARYRAQKEGARKGGGQ